MQGGKTNIATEEKKKMFADVATHLKEIKVAQEETTNIYITIEH